MTASVAPDRKLASIDQSTAFRSRGVTTISLAGSIRCASPWASRIPTSRRSPTRSTRVPISPATTRSMAIAAEPVASCRRPRRISFVNEVLFTGPLYRTHDRISKERNRYVIPQGVQA